MKAECFLDNDGGSQVIAVEEQGPEGVSRQSLWVRVGPVWRKRHEPEEKPMVWIEYQAEHMESELMGCVMLTPEVWRELSAAVEHLLQERDC